MTISTALLQIKLDLETHIRTISLESQQVIRHFEKVDRIALQRKNNKSLVKKKGQITS